MAESDWEDVPQKKASAGTATADGDWEDVSSAPEPTEENLPGMTESGRAATKAAGVKPMSKVTKFEEGKQLPEWYGFTPSNILSNAYEGAKGVIGSTLQGAYDLGLGEVNPKTGEIEHGLGGLVGMNTQGEFAPVERATALAKKYIGQPAMEELGKAKDYAQKGELSQAAGHGLAAAVPLVGPWAASLGEQAGTGDIGGAGAQVGGALLGGEMMAHPVETAKIPLKLGGKALDALGNPLSMGLEGHEMLTKGVRPRARAHGWQDAIQSPGVQREIINQNAQIPIKSVEDFKDATPAMKDNLWDNKIQPALDRQGPRPVDMTPVAAKVRAAITPEMREFDEPGVALLENLASKLEKSRTVEEVNRLQKYANDRVQGFFDLYPTARRSAVRTRPEVAGWENARQATREALIKVLDDAGETEAAPARVDYGHITAIEKELERKVNPNDRKAPTGLYNFLGSMGGLGMILMGHSPAGVAMYGMGKLAEHYNKPDVLIRRGIANLKPEEAPAFTPPQPYQQPVAPISRQLPAVGQSSAPSPIGELPQQGTAELLHPEMFPKEPIGVPAPRQTYREPETGRMARGFTGEMPPRTVGQTAEGGAMMERLAPLEAAQKAVGTRSTEPEGLHPDIEERLRQAGRRVEEQQAEAGAKAEKEQGFTVKDRMENLRKEAEAPEKVAPAGKLGPIKTTGMEDLKVGDTFVDEKGEPRRITEIEDGKIKTADGTLRNYNAGEIEHQGEINSPRAQLARGGKFHPKEEVPEEVGKITSGDDVVKHAMKYSGPKINMREAEQLVGLDSAGNYRLVDLPLKGLEAGDDFDPDLAKQYANKKGEIPAIIMDGDGRVRDGNHRIAAAKIRGDETIKAYVPISEMEGHPAGEEPEEVGKKKEPENVRVSTRVPTAVKASENPHTNPLTIDMDAVFNSKHLPEKLANLVKEYPGVKEALRGIDLKDSKAVMNGFIEHVAKNLEWLHGQMPPEIRAITQRWYESANKIAGDSAKKYGYDQKQTAGAMAALSPQKDWNMNVSLQDRVADTLKNHSDEQFTPEMQKKLRELTGKDDEGKIQNEALKNLSRKIKGKKLSDLSDPVEKAAWVRLYDEAHNSRAYDDIAPDGTVLGKVKNANGAEGAVAWDGIPSVAKAISILEDGSKENISRQLGEMHKVRNFYNNIIDPNGKYPDVTVDTHAVAAGLIRPLSGQSLEVNHNFSGPSDTITGSHGTYPLFAEAYRRAAAKLGLQPRQLQSIVWEQVRDLFPDTFKTEANGKKIANIWGEYGEGKITLDEARRQIVETAGGFKTPEWFERRSSSRVPQEK